MDLAHGGELFDRRIWRIARNCLADGSDALQKSFDRQVWFIAGTIWQTGPVHCRSHLADGPGSLREPLGRLARFIAGTARQTDLTH